MGDSIDEPSPAQMRKFLSEVAEIQDGQQRAPEPKSAVVTTRATAASFGSRGVGIAVASERRPRGIGEIAPVRARDADS